MKKTSRFSTVVCYGKEDTKAQIALQPEDPPALQVEDGGGPWAGMEAPRAVFTCKTDSTDRSQEWKMLADLPSYLLNDFICKQASQASKVKYVQLHQNGNRKVLC
ncbi:uncharacterized protein O3Q21_005506 isoform 1-T3 [Podargus strigoides]